MREILFKAKRVDNGEWVEGYYRRIPCMGWHEHYIMPQNPKNRMEQYEIDESTLCQYTGLANKNCEKIWENDIVEFNDMKFTGFDFFPTPVWGIVHWDCEGACFRVEYSMYVGSGEAIRNCKTIGNIFDNPDLIEGE